MRCHDRNRSSALAKRNPEFATFEEQRALGRQDFTPYFPVVGITDPVAPINCGYAHSLAMRHLRQRRGLRRLDRILVRLELPDPAPTFEPCAGDVPTVSERGMMVLALAILGTGSILVLRRRGGRA